MWWWRPGGDGTIARVLIGLPDRSFPIGDSAARHRE